MMPQKTDAERIEELQHKLTVEQKRAEEATVKLESLLCELWDGVRIHKLKAPTMGRDGERLIHAYCGGIVEAIERAERAEGRNRRAVKVLRREEPLWNIGSIDQFVGIVTEALSNLEGSDEQP